MADVLGPVERLKAGRDAKKPGRQPHDLRRALAVARQQGRDLVPEAGEQGRAGAHRQQAEADRLAPDPAGIVHPTGPPGLPDPHGGGLRDADGHHEGQRRALQRDRMGGQRRGAEPADDEPRSREQRRLDPVAQPDRDAEPNRLEQRRRAQGFEARQSGQAREPAGAVDPQGQRHER